MKTEISHDPAILLLGIYIFKGNTPKKDICIPSFIAALFTTAKIYGINLAKWITDEWTKYGIYTHNEILFSQKEE